ncbi:MAG TPA: hypothetical protein DEQ38_06090 [Elusimicrobia bacterium]|nr:MAG: hypothetical protein A2089_08795 [Elusimicrobia bacterium GWD2_63_28]HCC47672.1 hypothetical protein [Elusimicrobiota bacterium]
MIIVAGAKNFKEAEWLFANGAAEVYCALADLPNHRRSSLSVGSEAELLRITALARRKGKKALLLVNEACDPAKYPLLARRVKRLAERGIGGAVVREPSILELLAGAEIKADLILSSLALAFNPAALEYFMRFGIKRVILPFQLPPAQAAGLIRNRFGLETEMFYYASHFCQNVDPLCRFCDSSGDYKPCKIALGNFRMPSPGMDAMADLLYDGHKAGVKYLKIPRTLDFEGMKKFLADAKELNGLLEGGISRARFRARHRKVYASGRV